MQISALESRVMRGVKNSSQMNLAPNCAPVSQLQQMFWLMLYMNFTFFFHIIEKDNQFPISIETNINM